MITVYAENIKTGVVLELGEFDTMEEAVDYVKEKENND